MNLVSLFTDNCTAGGVLAAIYRATSIAAMPRDAGRLHGPGCCATNCTGVPTSNVLSCVALSRNDITTHSLSLQLPCLSPSSMRRSLVYSAINNGNRSFVYCPIVPTILLCVYIVLFVGWMRHTVPACCLVAVVLVVAVVIIGSPPCCVSCGRWRPYWWSLHMKEKSPPVTLFTRVY